MKEGVTYKMVKGNWKFRGSPITTFMLKKIDGRWRAELDGILCVRFPRKMLQDAEVLTEIPSVV